MDVDSRDGEPQPLQHVLGAQGGSHFSGFDEVRYGLGYERPRATGRVEHLLFERVPSPPPAPSPAPASAGV